MNTHPTESPFLTGLIILAQEPERSAAFYREHFGLPLEIQRHGPMREHLECEQGGIHFAVLKARPTSEKLMVPSFRVADLSAFLAGLQEAGIKPLHAVIDIGAGKRICTVLDPDGNEIRLIQIGTPDVPLPQVDQPPS
jgi:predicted enzyme related to lactoylglutathione lyase